MSLLDTETFFPEVLRIESVLSVCHLNSVSKIIKIKFSMLKWCKWDFYYLENLDRQDRSAQYHFPRKPFPVPVLEDCLVGELKTTLSLKLKSFRILPGHSASWHFVVLCKTSSMISLPLCWQYFPPRDLSHLLLCPLYPGPHGEPSTSLNELQDSSSSQSSHTPSLTVYETCLFVFNVRYAWWNSHLTILHFPLLVLVQHFPQNPPTNIWCFFRAFQAKSWLLINGPGLEDILNEIELN